MTTPLYYYGDWVSYRDVFRRAKQRSRALADIQLLPTSAEPGCGKVIAFEFPPFACDYAPIRTPSSELPENVASHILDWYLERVEEPRCVTMAGWLSKVFNREVREVPDEYADHGYEGERVFHAL